MTADPADSLADRWYQERQRLGLSTDSYHPLRQRMAQLLPLDALAGIAYREQQPVVIALTEGALLTFVPSESDSAPEAIALPLKSIGALAVAISEESTMHANYRVCNWSLSVPGDDSQEITSRRAIGSGFDSDNGGEAVILELAERLGWPTPLWLKAKEAA